MVNLSSSLAAGYLVFIGQLASLCRLGRSAPITDSAIVTYLPVIKIPSTLLPPNAALSADVQWSRVSSVVERSVERAHGIGAQQSAARQQLDAAEYTLQRLIDELADVMTLPVRRSQLVDSKPPSDRQVVQAIAA